MAITVSVPLGVAKETRSALFNFSVPDGCLVARTVVLIVRYRTASRRGCMRLRRGYEEEHRRNKGSER